MLNTRIPRLDSAAVLTALGLGLVLSLVATPVPAEDADLPWRFSAVSVNMSNVGPRGTARLEITVNRWSSDEERATLLEALKAGGRRSLPDALRDQESVGRFREVTSLAEDLFYSRIIPTEKGHMILMATDRPLAFAEVRRSARTRDYNVTIIQLNLDADGSGEGSIMAGAELSWDEDKNQIVIEHFASEPLRLTQVRRTR